MPTPRGSNDPSDPLGELIERFQPQGASNASALSDDAMAFVVSNAEAILGAELARVVLKAYDGRKPASWFEAFFEPRWRLGNIESVRLQPEHSGRSLRVLVRSLLQSRAATRLRSMAVHARYDASYREAFEAIAELSAPRLESLVVGLPAQQRVQSTLGDLSACWRALPALKKLVLAGKGVELGSIVAPTLEQFELHAGGIDGKNLQSIAEASWPALTTLILGFGVSRDRHAEREVDHLFRIYRSELDETSSPLSELLSGRRLPNVKFLGLMNATFTDALCAVLARSPIVAQLEVLDLSKGMMTEEGARHLLEHAGAFRHLEYLNLDENLVMDLGVRAALLETFPQLDFGVQRAPYDGIGVANE